MTAFLHSKHILDTDLIGAFLMARTVRDSKLDSRTARLKLPAGRRHWRGITEKLALGYRRTMKGYGTWSARYYDEDAAAYRLVVLGKADDHADADGDQILTFAQAQKKAQGDLRARSMARSGKRLKVRDAIKEYLEWYEAENKASGYRATKYAVDLHILPKFGDELLSTLDKSAIQRWHRDLSKAAPRSRGKTKPKPNDQTPIADPRARKASANRVLTILKAALNHAYENDQTADPNRWQSVKPFSKVAAPKIRFLSQAESHRLINACEPAFRPMVQAALLTGARYGELRNMTVSDFDPDSRTVLARETKNRQPRHIPLTDEGARLFEISSAAKSRSDWIFVREDGKPWGQSHQARHMQDACKRAGITPAISFHILRHTYGSMLAAKGVAILVIAKVLGHADTRITEKHYAHLSPSPVADTIRANLPLLGIEVGNVRQIKSGQNVAKPTAKPGVRKKN